MQIKEIKLTGPEQKEQYCAMCVCWICMRSPRLPPGYEKGSPAAPPPKPEQIQDRRVPTPGTHKKNTRA